MQDNAYISFSKIGMVFLSKTDDNQLFLSATPNALRLETLSRMLVCLQLFAWLEKIFLYHFFSRYTSKTGRREVDMDGGFGSVYPAG